MAARVQVIKEAPANRPAGVWTLCFQWCLYVYDDGTSENGYRFIWRRPDGSMQPARGQARIPSVKVMETLVQEAKQAKWGDYEAD